jgi:hypothetical protein
MNHGAGGTVPSFEQAISGDSAVVITTTDARDGATWTIQMRGLPDTIDPRNFERSVRMAGHPRRLEEKGQLGRDVNERR